MVLAHLRGLLRHDFSHGLRSVARENMVLQAIDYEMIAQAGKDQTLLQGAFASFISAAKVPDTMRTLGGSLQRLSELSMLNTKWQAIPKAVESIFKLYESLEKAGIIRDDPNVI